MSNNNNKSSIKILYEQWDSFLNKNHCEIEKFGKMTISEASKNLMDFFNPGADLDLLIEEIHKDEKSNVAIQEDNQTNSIDTKSPEKLLKNINTKVNEWLSSIYSTAKKDEKLDRYSTWEKEANDFIEQFENSDWGQEESESGKINKYSKEARQNLCEIHSSLKDQEKIKVDVNELFATLKKNPVIKSLDPENDFQKKFQIPFNDFYKSSQKKYKNHEQAISEKLEKLNKLIKHKIRKTLDESLNKIAEHPFFSASAIGGLVAACHFFFIKSYAFTLNNADRILLYISSSDIVSGLWDTGIIFLMSFLGILIVSVILNFLSGFNLFSPKLQSQILIFAEFILKPVFLAFLLLALTFLCSAWRGFNMTPRKVTLIEKSSPDKIICAEEFWQFEGYKIVRFLDSEDNIYEPNAKNCKKESSADWQIVRNEQLVCYRPIDNSVGACETTKAESQHMTLDFDKQLILGLGEQLAIFFKQKDHFNLHHTTLKNILKDSGCKEFAKDSFPIIFFDTNQPNENKATEVGQLKLNIEKLETSSLTRTGIPHRKNISEAPQLMTKKAPYWKEKIRKILGEKTLDRKKHFYIWSLGFASTVGNTTNNENLAERRALFLENLLKEILESKFQYITFKHRSFGEKLFSANGEAHNQKLDQAAIAVLCHPPVKEEK